MGFTRGGFPGEGSRAEPPPERLEGGKDLERGRWAPRRPTEPFLGALSGGVLKGAAAKRSPDGDGASGP